MVRQPPAKGYRPGSQTVFDAGAHLVERVRADLPGLLDGDPYVWIACDAATTRMLASSVRKELAVPRGRVHALGYWRAEPGA